MRRFGLAAILVVFYTAPAAGEFEALADQLWSYPVLYESADNPYVQRFALVGRYQGQWHHVDANTGSAKIWLNRRWRFGFNAAFLEDFEADLQFTLDRTNDLSQRFFRFVEGFSVEWSPDRRSYVSAGKQKVKITREWATSSRRIHTFERSLLVNQVVPNRVASFVAGRESGPFLIEGAVATGALDDNWEMPEFKGGLGLGLRFVYEVSRATDVSLDYFYQDGDEDNNGFEDYSHTFSLNTSSKWGRWGLDTDLIYGDGLEDDPNVYGVVLIPWFDLTSRFRLVGHYHYAGSNEDDGIRLQSRIERPAVQDGSGRRGDNYHLGYAGLNLFLYGDKLKIMNGLQFSSLKGEAGFEAWAFSTGIRQYF